MNAQPKSYKVSPESEMGRLVKEAAVSRQSIRVDTGEAIYSVVADTEVATLRAPTSEEVAASIAGIKQASGSWHDLVDAEELKAYISERRKTKNRPSIQL